MMMMMKMLRHRECVMINSIRLIYIKRTVHGARNQRLIESVERYEEDSGAIIIAFNASIRMRWKIQHTQFSSHTILSYVCD